MQTKTLTAQILTIVHNARYNSGSATTIQYDLKKMGIIKSYATIRRHCKILQSLKIVEPHTAGAFGSPVRYSTRTTTRRPTYYAPPQGNITVEQAMDHINKINQLKKDVVAWRRLHG